MDCQDLLKLKEIDQNPLKQNILTYLTKKDSKKEGEINFELFCCMLDTFQNKNLQAQKKCK